MREHQPVTGLQPGQAEIRAAAEILKKLEPGYLPPELFFEFTRLTVTPVVEVVPLRLRGDRGEVLLLRRDESDPIWGGLLHTPGTVIRTTDSSVDKALARLLRDELQAYETSEAVFVENRLHYQSRGMELAIVYWVEIRREAGDGRFHDVSRLPKDLVETQREFIDPAWKHFVSWKRGGGRA